MSLKSAIAHVLAAVRGTGRGSADANRETSPPPSTRRTPRCRAAWRLSICITAGSSSARFGRDRVADQLDPAQHRHFARGSRGMMSQRRARPVALVEPMRAQQLGHAFHVPARPAAAEKRRHEGVRPFVQQQVAAIVGRRLIVQPQTREPIAICRARTRRPGRHQAERVELARGRRSETPAPANRPSSPDRRRNTRPTAARPGRRRPAAIDLRARSADRCRAPDAGPRACESRPTVPVRRRQQCRLRRRLPAERIRARRMPMPTTIAEHVTPVHRPITESPLHRPNWPAVLAATWAAASSIACLPRIVK